MNPVRTVVAVLLLGVLMLSSTGVARAAEGPFAAVVDLAKAAKRITADTVPPIRKMVADGDVLLKSAIATGNPLKATLAAKLFSKAIKLARVEHNLRRRVRNTYRRLQAVRTRYRPGADRAAVNLLRQAENLLASIRRERAFFNLKHAFIRRTLRIVDQRLRRFERFRGVDEASIQKKLKTFERRFRSAEARARTRGNGAWRLLRRADNAYRRARAALDSNQDRRADRLADKAIGLLDDLDREVARARRRGHHDAGRSDDGTGASGSGSEKGSGNGTAGGSGGKSSSFAASQGSGSSPEREARSARAAIDKAERLRASLFGASHHPAMGSTSSSLVARADRLVADARLLADRGRYRMALGKAVLAERLYARAREADLTTPDDGNNH